MPSCGKPSKLIIVISVIACVLLVPALTSILVGSLCTSEESQCHIPKVLGNFLISFGMNLLFSPAINIMFVLLCYNGREYVFFFLAILIFSVIFMIIGLVIFLTNNGSTFFGIGSGQFIGNAITFIILYYNLQGRLISNGNSEKSTETVSIEKVGVI